MLTITGLKREYDGNRSNATNVLDINYQADFEGVSYEGGMTAWKTD